MSEVTTEGMTIDEAHRHLLGRTQRVFDTRACRWAWTVRDAHAARIVLYELARIRRQNGRQP